MKPPTDDDLTRDMVSDIRQLEADAREAALQYLSDTGQMADKVDALTAERDALRAALDRAEADKAAAVEAMDDAKALNECACGHEYPDDICMGHIAILNRVRVDHPAFDRARAAAVEAERERLRAFAINLKIDGEMSAKNPNIFGRRIADFGIGQVDSCDRFIAAIRQGGAA